jgi:hypothetical protein
MEIDMNYPNKLKTLAVAVALLSGSQAAQAVTPWQADDGDAINYGTPDYVIYTSGGAALDNAYDVAVADLAKPGTLTIFRDAAATTTPEVNQGTNFSGYYFIGANNLTNTSLRGKKIYLAKRSRGAAGYGVVPVLGQVAIDQLDIFKSATSKSQAGWLANASGSYYQVINLAAAPNYLRSHFSHGGFLGVDAASLILYPSSVNYPTPTTEISTGAVTAPWNIGWTTADLSNVTRLPAGGLTYGVAVTTDLYKVLQAAQIASGKLPASTTIGDYSNEAAIPSLSRDFVASLLAGKIRKWSDVKVDTGAPVAPALTTFAGAAGVPVPPSTQVAVARRNNGAAIGAAAYATFLNYPYAENSVAPATPTTAGADNGLTSAVIRSPGGVNATNQLLTDWEDGTNTSALNTATVKKYWGVAVNTGTANDGAAGAKWRYVKIDGFAPTVENVASGSYPHWAEGEVLITAVGSNPAGSVYATTQETKDLLTDFAGALGSASVAATVNNSPALAQPWAATGYGPGIFATAGTPTIPFVNTNPTVGLSHVNGDGKSHLGIRAVSTAGNIIELK